MKTRELLYQIAQEMNKPPQTMDSFIKILEDAWYEDANSLAEITPEQWKQFQMPMRLVTKIQEKIGKTEKPQPEQQQIQYQQVQTINKVQQQNKTLQQQSALQQEQQQNPISAKNKALLQSLVEEIKQMFKSEIQAKTQITETITSIQSIVVNILNFPYENKYRTLKLKNQNFNKKVGQFSSALNFLQNIGFIHSSQSQQLLMNIPQDATDLYQTLEDINQFGGNYNVTEKQSSLTLTKSQSTFDPYKASIISTYQTAPDIQKFQSSSDLIQLNRQISQLQEAELTAMMNTTVYRNVQIFILQEGATLQQILNSIQKQEEQALAQEINPEEENLIQNNIQQMLKQNMEAQNFQSKRKKQLEKLSNKTVFTQSTVRVRFPDRTLLQACFNPLENIQQVYELLKKYLEMKNRQFYIYTSPPKQNHTNMNQTLKELGFYPSVVFYFAWKDLEETKPTDGPFLDQKHLKNAIMLS